MHEGDLNPAELARAQDAERPEPELSVDEGSVAEAEKAALSKITGDKNRDLASPMSATSDHRKLERAAATAIRNARVRASMNDKRLEAERRQREQEAAERAAAEEKSRNKSTIKPHRSASPFQRRFNNSLSPKGSMQFSQTSGSEFMEANVNMKNMFRRYGNLKPYKIPQADQYPRNRRRG